MGDCMKKIYKVLFIVFGIIWLVAASGVSAWLIANRTNGRIVSSGEVRKYLLYVPESYDGGQAVPLVINIHGFAQWPANQMKVSQWNVLADEFGFIVVYPMGTSFPLRWRVSEVPSLPGGPDKEIAFFNDLIDKLSDEYNIDPQRIYANGLSNGGGMSLLLACRLSERIAAMGGVAGAYLIDLEKCEQERAVPAIFFHGKADKIVPYEGGPSERFELPFPYIPDYVKLYAEKIGCDLSSEIIVDTENITGVQYAGCNQGAEAVFYSIEDGGHTWPGGNPLPERITGKTSQEINATRLMWEFFERFSLE